MTPPTTWEVDPKEMPIEARDKAYHALITCDGEGKEAKAEHLRHLIEFHRKEAYRLGLVKGANASR